MVLFKDLVLSCSLMASWVLCQRNVFSQLGIQKSLLMRTAVTDLWTTTQAEHFKLINHA